MVFAVSSCAMRVNEAERSSEIVAGMFVVNGNALIGMLLKEQSNKTGLEKKCMVYYNITLWYTNFTCFNILIVT